MLTLALGMGAATAILNVADEAHPSPLPLLKPQQLVAAYSYDKKTGHYVRSSWRKRPWREWLHPASFGMFQISVKPVDRPL